jgi:Na+/phosphate symporter
MYNIINFLGGLGLFLFAMSLLENSIKNLGMKRLLLLNLLQILTLLSQRLQKKTLKKRNKICK